MLIFFYNGICSIIYKRERRNMKKIFVKKVMLMIVVMILVVLLMFGFDVVSVKIMVDNIIVYV